MALYDDPPLHDFPDRAIRRLLENPGNLADLLAAVAPDLAPGFDCSRAVLVIREFTLPSWQQHEHDLLFELPFRAAAGDQPAAVAVLVEHQSQPDAPIPLRLLLFAGYYWERQWRQWEAGHERGERFRVRPVLPIVFHTGPRPWAAPPQVADVFALPPGWEGLAPAWPIRNWDVTAHPAEALRDAAGPWLQTLAIVRAEDAPAAEYNRLVGAVVRRLEGLAAADLVRWKELLWFLLSWVLRRRPRAEHAALNQTVLASPVNVAVREEVARMSQGVSDRWEDWVAERVAERVTLQTTRQALQAFLEARFGSLPEAILQEIAGITEVSRLKAAIPQAARVQRLEDFRP
jgi:hypothetical protein